MERFSKRMSCLILAAVITLMQVILALPLDVFSQTAFVYSPARQKYAIAPAALYKDDNFYNQYVKTSEIWAFNSITYFTGGALNYNFEKTDYMNSFSQSFADFDPVLESLRKKGDLYVNLRVSLANSKPHWFTGERGIASAGITYITDEYWSAQADAEYRVFGDKDYHQHKGSSMEIYYKWVGKEGTRMKDSSLVFADITSPEITEIYTSSTIDGSKQTNFTKDNTEAFIHVKFNENIRFSDCNYTRHDNILLKLKIATIGGMEITDDPQFAKLVRLKNDTLTFLYDFPDKIKGADLNHCIIGIGGIFDDDRSRTESGRKVYVSALDGGANAYDLKVQTYTGDLSGHYENGVLKYYKSRSLITDLAGNPASTKLSGYQKTIYLDKTSPFVSKVYLNAPEDKSQCLGPGYVITPTVVFSEPLYANTGSINTPYYMPYYIPGLISAQLNVRDQWGNYVWVQGKAFHTYTSNDGTTVTDTSILYFNSVALPKDYIIEPIDASTPNPEGRIWIRSITINSQLPAYDARGNPLGSNLSGSAVPLPEDEFYYDTGKPVIATKMALEGDEYKPVLYDSDGDGLYDSFWLSFGIHDTQSGAQPFGNEKLEGIFSWSPQYITDDFQKKTFQYAFSDSGEAPGENQTWNTGYLYKNYSFTQLQRESVNAGDNIFLHVRLDGLEEVALDRSMLYIKAFDRVGNNDSIIFRLDGAPLESAMDRNPPTVTKKNFRTYRDITSSQWNFRAEFTLEDKSGIDTDSVYFQWTETGMVPGSGWSKLDGLGADRKSVDAVFEYTVTDDVYARDLYIKAADISANANILQDGPYTFMWNSSAPAVETEVSSDMTTKASLMIKADIQSATIQAGGSQQEIPGVILVKAGNAYKAITLSSAFDGDVFAVDTGWVKNNDQNIDNILNGSFYGEINVTVYTGYGISYSNGNVNDPYGTLKTESYKLYTAPAKEKIHNITMTSSLGSLPDPAAWNSPDDGPKYYTSLAGTAFNVNVENALMSGWLAKDIDFDNSFFAFFREGYTEPLYKAPVSLSSTITIPADLDYVTGAYYAEVQIKAKTSGHIDTARIDNILVDITQQPEDFGLSKTEIEWDATGDAEIDALFGKIGKITENYEYEITDSESHEIIKSYGNPPSILIGSAENGFADASRKLYFTHLSDNNEFYIKVWNTTAGINEEESKNAAQWQPVGNIGSSGGVFTALVVDSAGEIPDNYSQGIIPLINNTENILHYQLCHANGTLSGEKTLLAIVSDEAPELEVALSPENVPSREVTAKVTNVSSYSDFDLEVMYWDGLSVDPVQVEEDEINITNQANWFYTSNIYGNYTILNKRADNLDTDNPELVGLPLTQGEGDGYYLLVSITEKSPWDLYMKFDDTYMARLGLSGYFPLEVPDAGETWIADTPRMDGIYKISRQDNSDDDVELTIYGVYLYDDGGGSAPETADVGYSLYAIDAAGNSSIAMVEPGEVRNARPELTLSASTVREEIGYHYSGSNIESMMMDLYSMRASFNLPVYNVTPYQHHNAENSYGLVKDFISIFRDGTHTITYVDIFGRNYEEEKVVENNPVNMNISMTRVDSNGNFTLFAEPVENEGKDFIPANEGRSICLFVNKYNASLFNEYTRALTARRATVQYSQSETAIIAMMEYRNTAYPGWYLASNQPIVVIDGETRKNPEITVNWYYYEFGSDTPPEGETQTDDLVKVWITSDIPISGINGKLLSHTFSSGDDESYIFEYAANDGTTGSIEVSLPVTIIDSKEKTGRDDVYEHDDNTGVDESELDQKPADTTPPSAIFYVFGNFGSIVRDKGDWNTWSGDPIAPLFTWASTFKIKTDIIDDSKTKIILLMGDNASGEGITYENAVSSDIQGVRLSGGNIEVTGQTDPLTLDVTYPEAFTVLLIDEANNKKTISFPANLWSQLDVTAPSIDTLEYKKSGFTAVDALFTLKDDKTPSGQIELISPTGLSYDVNTGVYKMVFTENREVEAVIRDLAGNIGRGTLSVTNLDDRPPTAAVTWWSKGYYNPATGVYDPTILTNEKTNQTITAKIAFDKTVKDVSITELRNNDYSIVQPADYGKYVNLIAETDTALIDFLDNCYVEIEFSGLNGKKNDFSISVPYLIDKELPEVTADINDLNTETSATVTFTVLNEPVHIYGPGETGSTILDPGDELIKTFTEKGTYIFRFTDAAGNTTTKIINIENIDEYPPGILLSDLPDSGIYFNESVTFKATMSEEGTLTFDGISQDVTAPQDTNNNGKIEDDECDWVSFTAFQNGNYSIIAEDIAGRKTTAYVPIRCIDNAGPTISFSPSTITVISGTDAETMSLLLDQGVTVSDNSTPADDIVYNHGTLTDSQLSIPGLYQIVYTAADQAGNESHATRYVKVFPAHEISVVINGRRTEQKGTVQLNTQEVTLEVSNLPLGDNEPYKVYLRQGVWTAGLMKGVQALSQPESFTLPERDCFYTIYIVTQNRGTYLTYLYIQD